MRYNARLKIQILSTQKFQQKISFEKDLPDTVQLPVKVSPSFLQVLPLDFYHSYETRKTNF